MAYKPGFIYLLIGHERWCRIGRTSDPVSRFRVWKWQSKNQGWGLSPAFLVLVDDQHHAEAMFHAIFDDTRTTYRKKGMGKPHEWFKLTESEIETFREWGEVLGNQVFDLNGNWQVSHDIAPWFRF